MRSSLCIIAVSAMEISISYRHLLSFSVFCAPFALLIGSSIGGPIAGAEPIPAKNIQGAIHGFLLLKASDGKVIAVGDMVQVAHGREIRARLVFHFRDGSIDDETTVFTQGNTFQLVSDHHIQKGPSFPQTLDLSVNVPTGAGHSQELSPRSLRNY